jgi:hypothetical protein
LLLLLRSELNEKPRAGCVNFPERWAADTGVTHGDFNTRSSHAKRRRSLSFSISNRHKMKTVYYNDRWLLHTMHIAAASIASYFPPPPKSI